MGGTAPRGRGIERYQVIGRLSSHRKTFRPLTPALPHTGEKKKKSRINHELRSL